MDIIRATSGPSPLDNLPQVRALPYPSSSLLTCHGGVNQQFPVKGQTVNTPGFVGHPAPVATIPPCRFSMKAATDNM